VQALGRITDMLLVVHDNQETCQPSSSEAPAAKPALAPPLNVLTTLLVKLYTNTPVEYDESRLQTLQALCKCLSRRCDLPYAESSLISIVKLACDVIHGPAAHFEVIGYFGWFFQN